MTGFPEDEIPELAARIAALSPSEAKELASYLKLHGVGPPADVNLADGNTTTTPNSAETP